MTTLNTKLLEVESALAVAPQNRLLIAGGIVELPSAGYLPVTPGRQPDHQSTGAADNGRRRGLELLRHLARLRRSRARRGAAYERISLLQGLDNPQNKPRVEILVPNGEIVTQQSLSPGRGFEATIDLNPCYFQLSISISISVAVSIPISRHDRRCQGSKSGHQV